MAEVLHVHIFAPVSLHVVHRTHTTMFYAYLDWFLSCSVLAQACLCSRRNLLAWRVYVQVSEGGPPDAEDTFNTSSIRFTPATQLTTMARPHSHSHNNSASLSSFATPFKAPGTIVNSRLRDRDIMYGNNDYTKYDRRRAGANLSKVDYDVSMEAFGQELWALMCLNVDMLWETEQLTEKMIILATRSMPVSTVVCIFFVCLVRMYVCIYIYIHTRIYVYIDTHTHIYMYIHAHTCTHWWTYIMNV